MTERWYLFRDEFGGRGHVPFESTDLSSGVWTVPADYAPPSRPRPRPGPGPGTARCRR